MAGSVYTDTSWLAKLYLFESESASCIAYLNAHRGEMYVSQLSDVEITAAISKAYSSSPVSSSRALALYKEDCDFGFLKRVPVDEKVYARAVDIATQHTAVYQLRSLDILQIAIAQRHGVATIASFDKRLRAAALALGLAVLPA
jgi:predicted nucleic acid-binding protein